MLKKFDKKGISLVELIIIVVVLIVLSAVTIPGITRSASSAMQDDCKTNIDVIISAVEMYRSNHDVYPASLEDIMGTKQNRTVYFPSGPLICPLGGKYIMNSEHNVKCTH